MAVGDTNYALAGTILTKAVAYQQIHRYDALTHAGFFYAGNIERASQYPEDGIKGIRLPGMTGNLVVDRTRYNYNTARREGVSTIRAEPIRIWSRPRGTNYLDNDIDAIDPVHIEKAFYPIRAVGDIPMTAMEGSLYLAHRLIIHFNGAYDTFLNYIAVQMTETHKIKSDYDNTSAIGVDRTWAQDLAQNSDGTTAGTGVFIQQVDLSPATLTTAMADSLVHELEIARQGIVDMDPNDVVYLIVGGTVFNFYKRVFERRTTTMRRVSDIESSGSMNFTSSSIYGVDNLVMVRMDDSAILRNGTNDTSRCILANRNGFMLFLIDRPLIGSVTFDAGGGVPSPLLKSEDVFDKYVDALGRTKSSAFRKLLNQKPTDPDIFARLREGTTDDLGKSLMNMVSMQIWRFPMSSDPFAGYYGMRGEINFGVLRVNPRLMREWQIPDAKLPAGDRPRLMTGRVDTRAGQQLEMPAPTGRAAKGAEGSA